jgi:hypothetical protein
VTDLLDLLEAVAENPQPIAQQHRDRIRAAITADGRAHGGEVNPNRVRATLSNHLGLQVQPQQLSATYSALSSQGVLVFDHWGTNDDTRGKNAGKPQRVWRWAGEAL